MTDTGRALPMSPAHWSARAASVDSPAQTSSVPSPVPVGLHLEVRSGHGVPAAHGVPRAALHHERQELEGKQPGFLAARGEPRGPQGGQAPGAHSGHPLGTPCVAAFLSCLSSHSLGVFVWDLLPMNCSCPNYLGICSKPGQARASVSEPGVGSCHQALCAGESESAAFKQSPRCATRWAQGRFHAGRPLAAPKPFPNKINKGRSAGFEPFPAVAPQLPRPLCGRTVGLDIPRHRILWS